MSCLRENLTSSSYGEGLETGKAPRQSLTRQLFFKRLKSLLHLDTLPSREGPTAKSWMLARLIAAALAQRLVQPSGPLSPWGYRLRELRAEPAKT